MRSVSTISSMHDGASPARAVQMSAQRRSRAFVIGLTCAGAAIGLLSFGPTRPALIWNFTPSVPVGLYSVSTTRAEPGDILIIAPDESLRDALMSSGDFGPNRYLLKPLATVPGDEVCRKDLTVFINGQIAATATDQTSTGQKLPRWSGCHRVASGELLVLSDHPSSLDGRYFGVIDDRLAIGVAKPILTFSPPEEFR